MSILLTEKNTDQVAVCFSGRALLIMASSSTGENYGKKVNMDFPGGPVVRNLPANVGEVGSIHGLGTKIPHAVGQLSLCMETLEQTF